MDSLADSTISTRSSPASARDYDSVIGRWTAKDPVRFRGADTNLYGYVSNDPVDFRDDTGNGPIAAEVVGSFCVGVGAGDKINQILETGSILDAIAQVREARRRSRERLTQCDGTENPKDVRVVEEGIEALEKLERRLLRDYADANKGGFASDMTTEMLCTIGAVVAGFLATP